jgi:hypothetical protein
MPANVTEQSILDALHQVPRERWGYVSEILHSLETTASQPPAEATSPKPVTAAELLAMPLAERDAVLEAQAASAEFEYRNDPELTGFDAFDEEDLYVDYTAARRGEIESPEP